MKPAAPPLKSLAEHEAFLRGLLEPRMPAALDTLEELLGKPEQNVRAMAARAIVGLGRRGALHTLPPELTGRFAAMLEQAKEVRRQQAEMRQAARGEKTVRRRAPRGEL